MTPQLKEQLRQELALDQPVGLQFIAYLSGIAKGNLGQSFFFKAPVFDVIKARLPWTLLLVGLSLILAAIMGIILGIESGWRRGNRIDKVMLISLMSIIGFPDFFIGIVFLIILAGNLMLFPLSGAMTPYSNLSGFPLILDILWHSALPIAALTLANVAQSYLLTRNTMILALQEPYMLTARAKGLPISSLKYRHAGRNAMLPVITMTGLWIGKVVTGALFIELVFCYPGLGHLTYQALLARDYPLLQGIFFILAVTVLLANLAIDIIYPLWDPRIRNAYTD